MRRTSNAAVARGIETTEPDAASWRAFDALPRPIRAALWAAPVPINPIQVRNMVLASGVYATLNALAEAISSEVDTFAADHARRHGRPLPHMAAEASLQRYEATPTRMLRTPAFRARRTLRSLARRLGRTSLTLD